MTMSELLTVAQAARRLGISEAAVRRRIERGTLASQRRGSKRLIPVSAVEYEAAQGDDATPTVESLHRGSDTGGNRGMDDSASTELVKLVAEALEKVEDATERRVLAEVDRDAAIERERTERAAREAAEAELVALRARVTELEAIAETISVGEGDADQPTTIDASEPDDVDELRQRLVELEAAQETQPSARSWWQRMLGGNP